MRSEGLLSSIRDRRESAYSDMWAENPAFVANVPGKVSMPSMTDQEKSEFATYRGEFGQK